MVEAVVEPKQRNRSPLWLAAVYGLILAAAVGLFLLIRAYGEAAFGPAAAAPPHASAEHPDALPRVLAALAAVIALGRLMGWLFARLGQPPVIGEVLAGILLGPSLLGAVAPELQRELFPASIHPHLAVLAQLGVVLYMFVVGLEMNPAQLRRHAHTAAAVSLTGIAVPFVLGAALALALYPDFAGAGAAFTPFALFLGVALAITAFPVLARILTDRGLSRTELGVLALTCAAVGDVVAWFLLALAAGVAQAGVGEALLVGAGAAVYLAVMLVAVRPLMARLARRCEPRDVPRGAVALVLVALLLSALATERVGIHALFGAFFLGAVIPHDSNLARALERRFEEVTAALLLPAFFALTGMRTEIGLLSSWGAWLLCGLIILAATAGKFGGTLLAARWTGLSWRTSAALGVLMNTRGLVELIVLNVGLEMGVISPTLFAMMVLMALVTTIATGPLLHLLGPTACGIARSPAH